MNRNLKPEVCVLHGRKRVEAYCLKTLEINKYKSLDRKEARSIVASSIAASTGDLPDVVELPLVDEASDEVFHIGIEVMEFHSHKREMIVVVCFYSDHADSCRDVKALRSKVRRNCRGCSVPRAR